MTNITGNNLQDLYSAIFAMKDSIEQAKEIAGRLRQDAVYSDNPAGQGSVSVSIDGFDDLDRKSVV